MFQHYIYELKSTLKMCIVTFLFNFTYCLYNMKPLLFLTIKTMMSFKELNFIFTEVTNAFISYLHIVMVLTVNNLNTLNTLLFMFKNFNYIVKNYT